ncbi:MAG: hypothetical protein PHH11_07940, partial [Methylomonas sp.]|nr:hypothetical protein [Methylomonas sp.]
PSGSPLAFAWRLTLWSFLMDSSKCQTFAVSPAEPGDFSFLVKSSDLEPIVKRRGAGVSSVLQERLILVQIRQIHLRCQNG